MTSYNAVPKVKKEKEKPSNFASTLEWFYRFYIQIFRGTDLFSCGFILLVTLINR